MTSAETTAVWEDYLTRVCELRNDDNLACEKRDRFVYRQIDRLESWLQELQGALSDKVSAQSRTRFSGSGTPTPKMMAYARSISRQVGVPLPDNALTDRQACSTFIDTYQAQASQNRAPTPKMLGLARKLAQERQLNLSDEIVSSFEACRAFIDSQLGSLQQQISSNKPRQTTRSRQAPRRQRKG